VLKVKFSFRSSSVPRTVARCLDSAHTFVVFTYTVSVCKHWWLRRIPWCTTGRFILPVL